MKKIIIAAIILIGLNINVTGQGILTDAKVYIDANIVANASNSITAIKMNTALNKLINYTVDSIYFVTGDTIAWRRNGTVRKFKIASGTLVATDTASLSNRINNRWSITGNASTTAGTNFIGTTDNVDLVFKRNSVESGRIGLTNTIFGFQSNISNLTGAQNTGVGASVFANNTSGNYNTAIGYAAMSDNESGSYNLGIGSGSVATNTSGNNNTGIGYFALNQSLTGSANTSLGNFSLENSSSGSNNLGLGYYAGRYSTTTSNQIFINSLDRSTYTGDTTLSPLWILQNATVGLQRTKVNGQLQVNGGTLFPATGTTSLSPLQFTSGAPTTTLAAGNLMFNTGLLILDSTSSHRDTLATRNYIRNNVSSQNISNASLTANGDYYQNWAGYGLRFDSLADVRFATNNGVVFNSTVSGVDMAYFAENGQFVVTGTEAGVSGYTMDIGNGGSFSLKSNNAAQDNYLTRFFIGAGDDIVNAAFTNANVGIGTSTPSTALHVIGAIKATDSISFTGLLPMSAGTDSVVVRDTNGKLGTTAKSAFGSTYLAGYGMGLTGSTFRVDSSVIATLGSTQVFTGTKYFTASNTYFNGDVNITSSGTPKLTITRTGGQSAALLCGTAGSVFEATNGGYFGIALEPLASFGGGSDYAMKIEGSTKNAHFGNLTYLTADAAAQLAVTTSSSSKVAFKVNAAASQSADLQQWNNSAGTALAVVNASGNFGIGTTSPAASALLDVTSTTKGFLPPRMTKAQRDAISSPATGLVIWQTDNTPGLRSWNGTNWMKYTETAD